MPGPERLRKLKSRRVVHKSTGGVLPWTPEPVDPVGNPPPPPPFNTVAHLPAAAPPASSPMKLPLTRACGATSPDLFIKYCEVHFEFRCGVRIPFAGCGERLVRELSLLR